MSNISIQGAVTGTGVFTIASPATNTDRTLTLPDEAGTVLTSASTVAASQITSALNATGSAPIYACRAWVNFNGTGTVAIRASGNVSSITDNSTGNYTVNFTTAMPDTAFACVQTAGNTGVNRFGSSDSFTVSSVRVKSQSPSAGEDAEFFSVSIFR